jgi:nucleoside-diphosphate-sugar epimerase
VKRLAEAALHCGVRHFVLVSSVAVYGTGHRRPPDESTECHPTSPYGCSKLAGEQKLLDAVQTSSLRATILRPVTLYGEGDPGNVGRLSRALETGTFCWIGSGNNRKCLLHRDDAARACVLAALSSPRAPAQIYNVSAPPVRMQDIVKGLADALGQRRPRMKVPPELARRTLQVAAAMWPLQHRAQAWLRTLDKWLGDDVYDGTRFVGDFQFHPEVPLREGLRRQVHAASRSKTTTIRRAA